MRQFPLRGGHPFPKITPLDRKETGKDVPFDDQDTLPTTYRALTRQDATFIKLRDGPIESYITST